MFRILNKLINDSKNFEVQTSTLDITKPGSVGKIILHNNDLYI
jgi:hypothetical protein